jgi:hypothetical protein
MIYWWIIKHLIYPEKALMNILYGCEALYGIILPDITQFESEKSTWI